MRIALDPWGGDYTSQFSVGSEADREESSVQALEERIEDRPWAPVGPCSTSLPALVAVVDGVMRSDAAAMVSEDDRRALALFGSYATGAVTINSEVHVVQDQVVRVFIAGGNWPEPQDLNVSVGDNISLSYRGISSPSDTYEKLREDLTNEMRRSEARVAEALSAEDSLILADGNLTFISGSSSVVGVIKTIHKVYLAPKRARILERLRPGERTPLFRIVSGRKKNGHKDGYSVLTCYLRLAQPQPIELPFAGLVRLEVKASLEDKAVELLDQAAFKVFSLASRPPKDPRAPQNLIPIGGLERQLRRKLGEPQLVRRAIEKELFRQAAKEA
jgi:uncharacterized protein